MSITALQSLSTYATWAELSAFLRSEAGGSLRIDDSDSTYALIRYDKEKSNMALSHVRAMRSVVWDTRKNVPVSVTPIKSVRGDSTVPDSASTKGYSVEQFLDGVMIGMFWDGSAWRIHTRSSLDATSRYFSNRTFAELFTEAVGGSIETYAADFDKRASYTFVLQHPENRIVTYVPVANVHLVQKAYIDSSDWTVRIDHTATESLQFMETRAAELSWAQVIEKLMYTSHDMYDSRGVPSTFDFQGIVIKDIATGERWKLRTAQYNYVRHLRGNSARRDFLYLQLWEVGRLHEYLVYYPEERPMVDRIMAEWNCVLVDVYRYYVDVFKARTLPKTAIPAKYKAFVYGLHQIYLTTRHSIDWRTTVDFMNRQDTAHKLYTINWELRAKAKALGVPFVSPTATTELSS